MKTVKMRISPLMVTTVGVLCLLLGRTLSLAQDSHNGLLLFGVRQNAGIIKQGTSISCEVSAFNSSLTTVSVTGGSNCGCTVAGRYDHRILPFGLIAIPITISTDEMKEGPQSRSFNLDFRSGGSSWHRNVVIDFSLTK